ncbi:MAG: acetolactate synthase small subunit [Candidatus Nitrosotenuis sp.]|nr:acetolactate synthase small subunit [Candidatus Nitrosotenuis sp.]
MWAILSLLVENKPGILFKVTHLFRSRNFNIDSISVGVTQNPEFSKMTITTIGDERQIDQIVKQLDKMIDTIEVKRLDDKKSVYRELVLFRVKISKASDSMEISNIANSFGAKIHDARKDSIMLELTATPDQINNMQELLKPYEILDMARTGVAALQRGGD